MKTCRSLVSGTPAKTSWRATPLPQSIMYATSFETMTCAGAELAFRGRGPPPVPRRMSFVFAPCAAARRGSHAAAANAAALVMNARRAREAFIRRQRCRPDLSDLDFGRYPWIHQRCATVRINDLACDPAGFFRAEKSHHVPDVFWRAKASHRCPTTHVPSSDEMLSLLGQCVQDAVFRPSRADRIHRDTALRHCDGEIANE